MVLLERFQLFSRLNTIGWNQNVEIRCDTPENLFSGVHARGAMCAES
jgi:hypothetical protein